jgi:serine phosphatase RsbU (regulator of sigma subunit)
VAPFLLRDGQVTSVDLPADLPFGLFPDAAYQSTTITLEPGDRLVLVTDGMLERNAANLEITSVVRATRTLHAREAVRELADGVLRARGRERMDDATILMVDWHGGHGRERHAPSGADSVPDGLRPTG